MEEEEEGLLITDLLLEGLETTRSVVTFLVVERDREREVGRVVVVVVEVVRVVVVAKDVVVVGREVVVTVVVVWVVVLGVVRERVVVRVGGR